ncbi:MAG: lysylphosphatidylglycerol synthase transmembrane domain-containing protein [Candidatus Brocadiia bacterium]|nr:lysylphosphatidylglycerol synthase transmembrane domain-containing protein [Candidatus Brocadiia bacterium]
MKRRWPGAVLAWLKPMVGIALLAILLHIVSVRSVLQELKAARPSLLALALVVVFGGMLISALKLWLLVRTSVPNASLLGVLHAYYVGLFFNNFLPTSVGGDVVKVAGLRRVGVPAGHGAACVVVERGVGLLVVMGLAAAVGLGWPGLFERLDLPAARWPMAALGLGAFMGLAVAYGLWRGRLKAFLKSRQESPILGRLYGVISAFYVFRDRPATTMGALGLSVVFYALGAANIVIVARAVGVDLPLGLAVGILPFVKIPEMLPVSPGALGVREGALAWCLAGVGATGAQAASVALLLRILTWAHSALGGCAYALAHRGARRPLAPTDEPAEEE